jgi:hypothetical protein
MKALAAQPLADRSVQRASWWNFLIFCICLFKPSSLVHYHNSRQKVVCFLLINFVDA